MCALPGLICLCKGPTLEILQLTSQSLSNKGLAYWRDLRKDLSPLLKLADLLFELNPSSFHRNVLSCNL